MRQLNHGARFLNGYVSSYQLYSLVWLTAAGIGGPYFGKVNEVASNDQTTFLPESADATQVQELQGEFTDSEGIPAIVLFVAENPSTEDQLTQTSELVETTAELDGVADDVAPANPQEHNLPAKDSAQHP